jgi:hypothetical protein
MGSFRLWLSAVFLLVPKLLAAQNPVPLIYQPLIPATVAPGQGSFTLTVHGTGFVQGVVVRANGSALKTTFVNSSTLEAEVPAKAVAHPGMGAITVANPGGIDSNVLYLSARAKSNTIAFEKDPLISDSGEVVVGDFNGDHKPDINVSLADTYWGGNLDHVDTYFSNGKGHFLELAGSLPITISNAGPYPVGDFNNDGKLDFAVADTEGNPSQWYDIFLGDGKGGFTQTSSHLEALGAVADVNGDGKLDFVVSYWDGWGEGQYFLEVYLGNGDGTFTQVSSQLLNLQDAGIPALGDFNGDGKIDVALPCDPRKSGHGDICGVGVLMGNGDGTFGVETDYPTANYQFRAVAADVNGDGKLDIVTNGVSVLLGDGKGGFVSNGGVQILPAFGGNVAIADMNGDGILYLVESTFASNDETLQVLDVLGGKGDGTFFNPKSFCCMEETPGPAGNFFQDVAIADFNNDGMLDVAMSGNPAVTVLFQRNKQ